MLRFLFSHISALYLSWYGDPTTTMTIHWHTPTREKNDTIHISDASVTGFHEPLEFLNVHTVHLKNLKPDHEYSFRIANYPKIYTFRTAPTDGPIRFCLGGDADYSTKLFRKINQTIVETDPLFCVIGGDIAYAVNVPFPRNALIRWLTFLSIWKEQMITPSGRLVPMVLGIGNHDITEETSNLFFTLFPLPERRFYRSLDFNDTLSLILLDTDHYSPIVGQQTQWLEQTLSERQDASYRFAVYHEAAYPSHYSYNGVVPTKIRKHWSPLFEKYKVQAAFENHNHTFKRTYPVNGVTYLGDGCWGAVPRKTNAMWYLEKRGSTNHVYLVDVDSKEAHIQAIDLAGEPFDELKILPTAENNIRFNPQTSHSMVEHL